MLYYNINNGIVLGADPSEEYLIYLKQSTISFRTRIIDILAGEGPSVGILCSGIKLSYKLVSAKSNRERELQDYTFNTIQC